MHYDQIDLDKSLTEYIGEMEKGLVGKKSSLSMLPSYVRIKEIHAEERKVLVIDAGGTHLRVGLISFDETGACQVEQKREYRMPGAEKQIEKADFFDTLVEYIKPFLHATKTIVISFAYPTQITPDKDGKIIKMVKEIRINGIEGVMLGKELEKNLATSGFHHYKVYVTNDTIATCLAGMIRFKNKNYDSYIGMVLGTGMNTCYIENVELIKKEGISGKGLMIINVESGDYNKQPRGKFDIAFDQTTHNPGEHTMEKMISGGYFGSLLDSMVRWSEKDALFSQAFYDAYKKMDVISTAQFSQFENGDKSCALYHVCAKRQDRIKLACLFKCMVIRAAKLVALQMAGASIKSGKGTSKNNPICITAEGSTFYKLKYLKDETEQYLKEWLEKQHGIYTHVVGEDNAVLKGSAYVALLE